MKRSTKSYIFDSQRSRAITPPQRETERYKSQQAVMECGCDAKTGERRGEVW
jgi:hypothetical protein